MNPEVPMGNRTSVAVTVKAAEVASHNPESLSRKVVAGAGSIAGGLCLMVYNDHQGNKSKKADDVEKQLDRDCETYLSEQKMLSLERVKYLGLYGDATKRNSYLAKQWFKDREAQIEAGKYLALIQDLLKKNEAKSASLDKRIKASQFKMGSLERDLPASTTSNFVPSKKR